MATAKAIPYAIWEGPSSWVRRPCSSLIPTSRGHPFNVLNQACATGRLGHNKRKGFEQEHERQRNQQHGGVVVDVAQPRPL